MLRHQRGKEDSFCFTLFVFSAIGKNKEKVSVFTLLGFCQGSDAEEVYKMLGKGALEKVKILELGYYSKLLLVHKASRGWNLLFDISSLKNFATLN